MSSDSTESDSRYPKIIEHITLPSTNASILIHDGKFEIVSDNISFSCHGTFSFHWLPMVGVRFSGKPELFNKFNFEIFRKLEYFEVVINGDVSGKAFLTVVNFDNFGNISFEGVFTFGMFTGDPSVKTSEIVFSIPNLRRVYGYPVQKTKGNSENRTSKSRFKFEDEKYKIIIDSVYDYDKKLKGLENLGGFDILASGKLICQKQPLNSSESQSIFRLLNNFLSFINGRRVSAFMSQGLNQDDPLWTDYTSYLIEPFSLPQTWCPRRIHLSIDYLWKNYTRVASNPHDEDFLFTAIHWYLNANNNVGSTESSIIMAQAALELIYNWWIVEKKGLLSGRDAASISASNKIRLIVKNLGIETEVPLGLKFLNSYASEQKRPLDGPDVISEVRNMIVHSQIDKRMKLNKIDMNTKYEILELCIWYIELALLNILDYNGDYYNRTIKGGALKHMLQSVPWVVKT
ncbi:hypothetical protein SAMN05192588_1572 [Nonlabens sp. Hel1_33_55]|uniref:hypothetical protein n=1 Tax=Nonlabens sp. Hel1_33_55 TaxID=1336802 RepID=UPI000875DBD0|nr:hypothetical protein [Nonlabens sp. Hel1_33_55]SCY18719.1 hypothetical protein SAMN05192588_1572 [Nonlabens sp. Hel1_33_55]